jgi:hypothetical protein
MIHIEDKYIDLSLKPLQIHSKNMLIIGSADSGDYLEPVYASSYEYVKSVFTSGQLINAYEVAKANGATNIYLMRVDVNRGVGDEGLNAFRENILNAYHMAAVAGMHIISPLVFDATEDIMLLDLVDFLDNNTDTQMVAILGTSKPQLATNINKITTDQDVLSKICVVATSVSFLSEHDSDFDITGNVALAALLSSLDSGETPAYKALNGIKSAFDTQDETNGELVKHLIEDFKGDNYKHLIFIRENKRRGFVVCSDSTLASPDVSPAYSRIQNIRMFQEISNTLHFLANNYIGEPVRIASKNIELILKEMLNAMKKEEKIRSFNYNIINRINSIEITIDITPIWGIDRVEGSVSIEV